MRRSIRHSWKSAITIFLATTMASGAIPLQSVVHTAEASSLYGQFAPEVPCKGPQGQTYAAGTVVSSPAVLEYMLGSGQIAVEIFPAKTTQQRVRAINVFNRSTCVIAAGLIRAQFFTIHYPIGSPLRYQGQQLKLDDRNVAVPAGGGVQFSYNGPACAMQSDVYFGNRGIGFEENRADNGSAAVPLCPLTQTPASSAAPFIPSGSCGATDPRIQCLQNIAGIAPKFGQNSDGSTVVFFNRLQDIQPIREAIQACGGGLEMPRPGNFTSPAMEQAMAPATPIVNGESRGAFVEGTCSPSKVNEYLAAGIEISTDTDCNQAGLAYNFSVNFDGIGDKYDLRGWPAVICRAQATPPPPPTGSCGPTDARIQCVQQIAGVTPKFGVNPDGSVVAYFNRLQNMARFRQALQECGTGLEMPRPGNFTAQAMEQALIGASTRIDGAGAQLEGACSPQKVAEYAAAGIPVDSRDVDCNQGGLRYTNDVGVDGVFYRGVRDTGFDDGWPALVCRRQNASSSSSSSALPQCRDGQDNDNDGAIDSPSDFSCSGPDDNDETNPRAQCQDNADNDGDGKVDSQDPGCHFDGNPGNSNSYNPQDNDEFNVASSAPFTPQCRDNIDNDGDGAIDYPSDFSCSGPDDNDELIPRAQCQDGIDNDGDGKTDFPQDPGCVSLQDNDEFNQGSSASSALPQCRNGMDDDGDGAIDSPSDFSCSGPDDNDETNPRAQCQDNADNDGDGKVDSQDPGCHYDGNPGNSNSYNPQDNDEFNQASSAPFIPQCRDNVDNDSDGATDYPSDFSCSHPDDNDETTPRTQCQDGMDNDGDSLVDFPQDPGCSSRQDNDEFNAVSSSSASSALPQCRDGIDNDGDGATDMGDYSCSHPDDNDETNPKAQCQDGIDNDGDGLTDFPQDPGCSSRQDNDEFNQGSSASSSSASSAPSAGCILVLNETFDTQGSPIYQATAQFTYTLDGNQTAVNNASGIARFDGVSPGSHLVSQQGNSAWTNLSITPAGGNVQVSGGPICAAVIFKNKQNSVGGQSSSAYAPYPYYQPDPYAYGNGKNEKMCRSLADKYGDRYANSKKRKKLPKAIKKLMDDCDDDFGNAAWWSN